MSGATDRRPNPEDLLRRVEADERRERRGRLKVFLGYASRVGKSQRMLQEGCRRKERGQDVVVGAIQPVVPAEVQEILTKLEVIPMVRWVHAGRTYEVIDLPALFRRHPGVCLIDGLANDNPPGSRNRKRWQDVNDLLDRGISVITAVNLQHIEEQQAAVERITGKRATQCVPQAFLADADEIEVVDAPVEELQATAGEAGIRDPRRLSELRELALLLAADVVDQQLLDYLGSHHLMPQWGTQERILVCLTPQSDPEMLRAGQRNARRFHGARTWNKKGCPPRIRSFSNNSWRRPGRLGRRCTVSSALILSAPFSNWRANSASPRSSSATASAVRGGLGAVWLTA